VERKQRKAIEERKLEDRELNMQMIRKSKQSRKK
jgi:hypothetical protein